jgi:two-component system, LuxR family, sensor kinase FixL
MTIFSFLSLLAAAVYAVLAVVVIRRSPKEGLNWFCGFILISYTVWALGNAVHHLQPLVTYEQAHVAHRVGMTGVYSYASSWLLFALALTNRRKFVRSWLTYVPVVGIPLVLIIHEWFGPGVGSVVTHGQQYWGLKWQTNSPWTILFTVYQGVAMLLGMYLVLRFGRRATQTRQRRQALITFWTAVATWAVGSGLDIFYVNATHQPATEISGSFLNLIWAVGLAVSMTRYGLSSYTVQAAADRILATVPDVLLLLDTDGSVLTANEATADVLGFSPKELAGQSASRLFKPPGDFQALLSRLKLEHHLPGPESVVCARDGRQVPVSITARTMPQADGTVRGSVWVLHDITAIRQAEELQAQMTREVAAANKELNDFAHVVSHDLKAPLRAIDTLAGWLGESCVDRLSAEEREQLDLLQGRVKRMHNLIEGVLQYSRAGRVREKQVEVSLSEMLPEVIDLLGPPAHIKVRIETPLPTISAERTRIEQVFQNLLSNAVKYNDKPEGLIRVGGIDDGEHWRFYVTDNGLGIEEKDFERIFQIFQTGKPRDQVESTGVGLAVVKRAVEMYGGRVWVESKFGEGSTFSFTYPKQVPDS